MSSSLVLDACCILNFASTNRLQDILKAWGSDVLVPQKVRAEALVVRGQPVSWEGFQVIDFENDDEFEAFVTFAESLGDGEAAVLALASCRKGVPATDDRKAVNTWQAQTDCLIVGTPHILKLWSESANVSSAELRAAILDIENFARYVPGKTHELKSWWESAKTR